MRRILKAIFAALAFTTTLAWETVNGVLRLVQKILRPPQPPLREEEIPVAETEAAARAFKQAHDKATAPGRDGVTHRHAMGLAAGMLCRGFGEYADELPDDVVKFVHSLTDAEREHLGNMRPDEIESVILGARVLASTAPKLAANVLPAVHQLRAAHEVEEALDYAPAPRLA